MLDGTQKSLQAALNIIEIYGSYSGLKINKDKTKVIWIGSKKGSTDKLNTVPLLSWGETEFDLLGLRFSVDLDKMPELNYDKYINQAKDTIRHWNKRYLTPLGKITVIKTFILSKFIHVLSILPNANTQKIKEIKKKIYNFIWDNKPEKLKRIQITQSYSLGGLQMTDIEKFIESLKLTWVQRFMKAIDQPWAILVADTIIPKNLMVNLGSIYIQDIIIGNRNIFWTEVLSSWIKLCQINKPKNILDTLTV